MGFKMKGNPFARNFGIGSPLKETEDIKWGPEKKVKTTVTKDKGTTTTKTDYETKGTSYTPPEKTPAGDEAYKKLTPAERKKQDDKYIKANTKKHTKGRSEVKKKTDAVKLKPKKVQPIPTETKEPEIKPVKLTIDQKRSMKLKDKKKKRRRRSNKPGTMLSRAVHKARKKAYSRRRVKRGGTKCTIGIGSRGRKPRGCKL